MKKLYPIRDPELRAYIINCMVMRFSEKESLAYLKGHGFEIHERTLYQIKKRIKESRFKRIKEIFDYGIIDQHLQAIDLLNTTVKEMWVNYHKESDPYKKVDILTQIINVQPYLSDYYYGTKKVVEKKKIEETDTIKQENESVL